MRTTNVLVDDDQNEEDKKFVTGQDVQTDAVK